MKYLLLLFAISSSIFANIGNIMALKGTATIHRAETKLPASNGMELKQGDTITTAEKTRAQIMLKDETVITVGSNSSFSFTKYFFDGTKASTIHMKSSRGFFRSVTGRIGKIAPERFQVKTSSATIGIRGTDFSVLQRDGVERFTCHFGAIRVKFGENIRDLKAGESFEFKHKKSALHEAELKPKIYDVSDIQELVPPTGKIPAVQLNPYANYP